MYKFGRFLTVSVLAICAVSAANATVVTQTRLNTALGDKVNVDQTATNKDKAVITNSSGQITTGTIATGMITEGAVTEGKLASNAVTSAKIANGTIENADIANGTIAKAKLDSSVQESLGKADTAIQSHQDISGKQDKLSSETGGNVTISGNSGFVKTVTASDGTLAVTRSTIAASDVPTLSMGKINGLESALDDKEDADNKVTSVSGYNDDLDASHYPSMLVADAMISDAFDRYATGRTSVGDATHPVYIDSEGKPQQITSYDGNASTATVADSANSVAWANVQNKVDASTTAKGIMQVGDDLKATGGVVSVDKATSVASGNTKPVTSGAVYTEVRPAQTNATNQTGYLGAPASTTTAANLTALDGALSTIHPNSGEVKIPSGSATSSTLASIWVE